MKVNETFIYMTSIPFPTIQTTYHCNVTTKSDFRGFCGLMNVVSATYFIFIQTTQTSRHARLFLFESSLLLNVL